MSYTLVQSSPGVASVHIALIAATVIGKVHKAGGVMYATHDRALSAQRRINFGTDDPDQIKRLRSDCSERGSFSRHLFVDKKALFMPSCPGENNFGTEISFHETRSEDVQVSVSHRMSGGKKYINIDRKSLINKSDTQRMRFANVDELRDLQIVLKEMIESIENE